MGGIGVYGSSTIDVKIIYIFNRSLEYAFDYSTILQTRESAPNTEPLLINAYQETQQFWQLWGITQPLILCQRVKEWDAWYEDEEKEEEPQDNIIDEPLVRHRLLYVHPNVDQPMGLFDLEDVEHQCLCLLMKESVGQLQVFIWRGLVWEGNEDVINIYLIFFFPPPLKDERDFVDNVIQEHYRHVSHENIFIYKEVISHIIYS